MTPLIIVLGPAGSGRSILLKELIENAWPAGKQVRTFRLSSDAPTDHPATDFWTLTEGQAVLPAPGTEDAVILVSDGRRSVVDQMESLHRALYGSTQWQIQRIVTVLDCTLAHRHPVVAEWYGAAVHFADAVIEEAHELGFDDYREIRSKLEFLSMVPRLGVLQRSLDERVQKDYQEATRVHAKPRYCLYQGKKIALRHRVKVISDMRDEILALHFAKISDNQILVGWVQPMASWDVGWGK